MLCKPLLGSPLRLYFAITERAISSVLLQEKDHVQKPIYFVRKVLQGPEVRHQAIERSSSCSACGTKAPSLLPEFHCDCDDEPPYLLGLTEARCGRKNGALGSWVTIIRYTVWTNRTYHGPGLRQLRGRTLLSNHTWRISKFQMGPLRGRVLQPTR